MLDLRQPEPSAPILLTECPSEDPAASASATAGYGQAAADPHPELPVGEPEAVSASEPFTPESITKAQAAIAARWAKVRDGSRSPVVPSSCSPSSPPSCSLVVPSSCSPSSPPTGWETVRYYITAAEKFQRASLAAQVMAGFALIELRREALASQRRGRPSAIQSGQPGQPGQSGPPSELPNDLVITNQLPWAEQVAKFAGISDETARNWMLMAQACKPRLKKLSGLDRLRSLLEEHPSRWSQDDTILLETAVHKITDGRTQLDFMRELGLAKLPPGSAAKGGALGKRGPAIQPSFEESTSLARADWLQITQILSAYDVKFSLLSPNEIELQIHILELCAAKRREFLARPKP